MQCRGVPLLPLHHPHLHVPSPATERRHGEGFGWGTVVQEANYSNGVNFHSHLIEASFVKFAIFWSVRGNAFLQRSVANVLHNPRFLLQHDETAN